MDQHGREIRAGELVERERNGQSYRALRLMVSPGQTGSSECATAPRPIYLVFADAFGPDSGHLIDVVDEHDRSIRVGEWLESECYGAPCRVLRVMVDVPADARESAPLSDEERELIETLPIEGDDQIEEDDEEIAFGDRKN